MAIGTGLAAILGGGISALGASKAAGAQKDAARDQVALAKETRDLTRADLAPFLQGGLMGNQAYMYELGLGSRPMIGGTAPDIQTMTTPGQTTTTAAGDRQSTYTGPATNNYQVGGKTFATIGEAQAYANANKQGATPFGGYQKTPGYDFQFSQGLDAVQSTAAGRSGLYSGATMQAAQGYGQGLASQDYTGYLNRLAALGQQGQSAAAMQADANTNYAQMGTNALGALGNAQSAGAIGMSNAINGGLQNAIGAWQYQNTQTPKSLQGNWLGGWGG